MYNKTAHACTLYMCITCTRFPAIIPIYYGNLHVHVLCQTHPHKHIHVHTHTHTLLYTLTDDIALAKKATEVVIDVKKVALLASMMV